jgi:hypothetical protein
VVARVFFRRRVALPHVPRLKKPSPPRGGGFGVGGIHRRTLRNKTGMIDPVQQPQLFITPG